METESELRFVDADHRAIRPTIGCLGAHGRRRSLAGALLHRSDGAMNAAPLSMQTPVLRYALDRRSGGKAKIAAMLTRVVTTTYQAGALGSPVAPISQVTTSCVVPPNREAPTA